VSAYITESGSQGDGRLAFDAILRLQPTEYWPPHGRPGCHLLHLGSS